MRGNTHIFFAVSKMIKGFFADMVFYTHAEKIRSIPVLLKAENSKSGFINPKPRYVLHAPEHKTHVPFI
jgi:hypothetical protein